jgi:hypothetical protein
MATVFALALAFSPPPTTTISDAAAAPEFSEEPKAHEMTPENMLDLMDRFLRKDFDLKKAQVLFGPVIDASNPNNFVAQPRDGTIERLVYGSVDLDEFRLLMSIAIKYKVPKQTDLAPLIRALGDPRRGARLKPDQPRPHIFDVNGDDFTGMLKLGLVPGEGLIRDMVTLQIVRILPDT